MNGGEALSIERLIGRLEQAVRAIEIRIPELTASLERERANRQTECARHWAVTDGLSHNMTMEQAVRETVGKYKQQQHWVIERIFQAVPWVTALIAAAGGWLIAKGQL